MLYFVLTHLKYRQANIFTYLELVTIINKQYLTLFIKSSSSKVSLFHKFPALSGLEIKNKQMIVQRVLL